MNELENEVKKKWLARRGGSSRHIGLTTRKHLRSSPLIDGSVPARRDRRRPRPTLRPMLALRYAAIF